MKREYYAVVDIVHSYKCEYNHTKWTYFKYRIRNYLLSQNGIEHPNSHIVTVKYDKLGAVIGLEDNNITYETVDCEVFWPQKDQSMFCVSVIYDRHQEAINDKAPSFKTQKHN